VPDDLIRVIREVHAGQRAVSPDIVAALEARAMQPSLTTRELQVLELLATGKRNKEIAAALGMSGDTASAHIKNIFQKFNVHDRTAAMAEALPPRASSTSSRLVALRALLHIPAQPGAHLRPGRAPGRLIQALRLPQGRQEPGSGCGRGEDGCTPVSGGGRDHPPSGTVAAVLCGTAVVLQGFNVSPRGTGVQ
jgi:DNA-binding CsgD family transcriptional regulator